MARDEARTAATVGGDAPSPAPTRPNILVFITDQQRADHVGYAGNAVVRTPHLDALVAGGVGCDRSYVANPVCMPARATLFTGLTPRGHGVRTNGIPLDPAVPTLPEALRQGGYRTHAVGKLHFRNYSEPLPTPAPDAAAYDRLLESRQMWEEGRVAAIPPLYAGLESADYTGGHGAWIFGDYLNWLRDQTPDGPRLLTHAAGVPAASGAEQTWTMALPAELHYTTWVAERSVAFLRRHAVQPAGAARPFFLWCSFPDPHHPYCPPEPWASMYRPEDVALPNRRDGELDNLPPHYRAAYERDVVYAGRHGATRIADDQLREIIARTYGMVSFVDDGIGRVLTELTRLGLRDDTVIVFLSDHGDMMGDHWMLNKGPFHFDGLLRVPTLWHWPRRFAAGMRSDALVSHLDFAPTVLDLAGVPIPEGPRPARPVAAAQLPPWPGRSLVPLLTGEVTRVRDTAVIENDEDYLGLRLRTLVTERYQLTVYPGQPYGELFNREADPAQQHNRWADPALAAIRDDLRAALLDQLALTDTALPRRMTHA